MFNKIGELFRSANARIFTGVLALAAMAPALVHAEGGTGSTITLDSSISGIDIASGLSSVGSKVAEGLCLAIGLAAAIWAIQLVWRKIRGTC